MLASGFSITILTSYTAVMKLFNLVANINLCLKVQVKKPKKVTIFFQLIKSC